MKQWKPLKYPLGEDGTPAAGPSDGPKPMEGSTGATGEVSTGEAGFVQKDAVMEAGSPSDLRLVRADLCGALPGWIAKNDDLGPRARARLEALAARVAKGYTALTTREMVEVYDAAPSKTKSADVMGRKTFAKLIRSTEASAKKREAQIEAAQRSAKKTKLQEAKAALKARKQAAKKREGPILVGSLHKLTRFAGL